MFATARSLGNLGSFTRSLLVDSPFTVVAARYCRHQFLSFPSHQNTCSVFHLHVLGLAVARVTETFVALQLKNLKERVGGQVKRREEKRSGVSSEANKIKREKKNRKKRRERMEGRRET